MPGMIYHGSCATASLQLHYLSPGLTLCCGESQLTPIKYYYLPRLLLQYDT